MLDRRNILKAGASLITLHIIGGEEAEAKTEKKPMLSYTVGRETFKAFPEGITPPPLLVRFSEWLASKPWPSVGGFDLDLNWSDGHFPGGEFHYDQFALFITLGDGSAIGYWLQDHSLNNSPIVLLGQDGDITTLAPNLETFLVRIALKDFDDNDGSSSNLGYQGEEDEDAVPDLRDDLKAFLQTETGIEDLALLARKARPAHANFAKWVEFNSTAHEAYLRKHPAFKAISLILAKYSTEEFSPYGATTISFTWAGDFFTATITSAGLNDPLPEASLLKPHLEVLRNEAAASKQGLGLWHSGFVLVMQGVVVFQPDYLNRPGFEQGTPSAEAFKADHTRAPRETRRIPPWLAEILGP